MLDIPWCQKMLESWRKSSTKENQQKTSKNSNETHKKHQKSEIKGKEVNSLDIPWLLETWMEQKKGSTQKNQQKTTIAAVNHPKKRFSGQKTAKKRPKWSKTHYKNISIYKKETVCLLIDTLKEMLEAILTTLRDKNTFIVRFFGHVTPDVFACDHFEGQNVRFFGHVTFPKNALVM